jgi:MscS family membrane protein
MILIKRIGFVLALIFYSITLFSQIDSSLVNDNPYTVIYNHLYYLQHDSYEPSRALISLQPGTENAENLSVKLKQVLDGKGYFVDLNRLPKENDYRDSLSLEEVYFINKNEPLIYVEKIDSLWFYSRTTIDAIPEMHRKLYPFGTQFLTKFQAPVWQIGVLGIKLWKWLGIVLLLVAAWLIFLIIDKISKVVFGKFLKKRFEMTERINKSLFSLSRLVGFIAGIQFLLYFIPMFQFAPKLTSLLIKGLHILSIFFVILIIKNISHILFNYLETLSKKTENTLDDQLVPVMEKLASIVVWAIGIIYILDYLDVNVTALLAGISIGGLALALAAQDTVKNFFGSIMIFLDKPFQIGDWINFQDVDGTVEEVGVRSTRIRTFGNSITYVPNAILANSVIDNKGLRVYRRFKSEFQITYDTAPLVIDQFVEGIKEIIKMHPYTRKDYFEVSLVAFGESSLNILMYTFFIVPSWTEELQGKHQILSAILKLAESLGVRFAYPTQTIHIEEMPNPGISNKPFKKSEDEVKASLKTILAEIKDNFDSSLLDANGQPKEGDE